MLEPLNEVIARLGRTHSDAGLDASSLRANPLEQFGCWLDDALAADLLMPNSMTLATASRGGNPSARIVLLKGVDERGFIFYTNYDSRKARELEANPRAALVFHWSQLGRQVRIGGTVRKVGREETERYWRTRPRGSRLGAWASRQSSVIASRAELESRLQALERDFDTDDVPLPPFWGGFVVAPLEIEFWQGRRDRLHDRWRYRRTSGRDWVVERLAP